MATPKVLVNRAALIAALKAKRAARIEEATKARIQELLDAPDQGYVSGYLHGNHTRAAVVKVLADLDKSIAARAKELKRLQAGAKAEADTKKLDRAITLLEMVDCEHIEQSVTDLLNLL